MHGDSYRPSQTNLFMRAKDGIVSAARDKVC